MNRSRLFVVGTVALLALGCEADKPGLTPPDPSYGKGGSSPGSCLSNAQQQTGNVFAGSFKGKFNDGLDANNGDGKISEGDAFIAAIRITAVFDPQELDFWSNDASDGDETLAEWANSLAKGAGPAEAAELLRQVFACAVFGDDGVLNSGDEDEDPFDSSIDWSGVDFGDDAPLGDLISEPLGFEAAATLALTRTGLDFDNHSDFGAAGVRNPLVPQAYAVTSPDDSNSEPYYGAQPKLPDTWHDVFGDDSDGSPQQVLVLGFATSSALPASLGGAYSFNAIPPFEEFNSDVVGGTCQTGLPVGGSGGQENSQRIVKDGKTVTVSVGDPDFCTTNYRAGSESSLFSSLANAVGRLFRPAEARAGAAVSPGGTGGGLANWSVLDVALIGAVEILFENQPCKDQREGDYLDFEPCDGPPGTAGDDLNIRARTVSGLNLEGITIKVTAVDNNGLNKTLGRIVGTTCVPSDDVTAETQNDASPNAGVAVFEDLCVKGAGGYRLKASVPDYSSEFAPVVSNAFQATPN